MKKFGKKVMVGLVALTAGILTASAKDVTVKELLEEVEAKNPTAQDVYIIGDYAFTTKHTVTSQDIMLSARSINISSIETPTSLVNRTNKGEVYKEMLMQHLNRTMDANGKYSNWSIVNPKIGKSDKKLNDLNTKVNVHFIDYELVNDVTADVEDQLKKDAETLNNSATTYGFNSITFENNTLTFDIANINKNLIDYKDSGIITMFKNIVSGKYGFTSITYTGVGEGAQPTTKTAEDLKSAQDSEIQKLAADVLLGLATKDGAQANTLTYLDVANKSTTAKVVYTDEYGTHEVTYTLKFTYDIEEEKDKDLTSAASTLNEKAKQYGFKSISYADKTATFEISDTQKPLAEFAQSGILDMFKQYIAGATKIEYTIGEKTVTIDTIDPNNGVKYAAQLLCLMANNGNEESCKTDENLASEAIKLKLGDVAGKKATANFTYTIGSETQTIPYTLGFKYDLEEEKNETLTHYAEGLEAKAQESGFSSIKYNPESHTATFTIKDGNKKLSEFAGKTDIINMFQAFVTDAENITWSAGSKKNQEFKKDNIDQDATVIKLAAELLCAMAEKESVDTCNPTDLKLSDVKDKTATATVSYKVGDVTGTQTYTLEFVTDASVTNITALNTELFNINRKLN